MLARPGNDGCDCQSGAGSQQPPATGHTPPFTGKEPHHHAAVGPTGERNVKRRRQQLAPAARRAPSGAEISRNKNKIKHKARGWRLLPHRQQLMHRGVTAVRRGAAPRCSKAETPSPGSAEVPVRCQQRGAEGRPGGSGEHLARKVRGWGGGEDHECLVGGKAPVRRHADTKRWWRARAWLGEVSHSWDGNTALLCHAGHVWLQAGTGTWHGPGSRCWRCPGCCRILRDLGQGSLLQTPSRILVSPLV